MPLGARERLRIRQKIAREAERQRRQISAYAPGLDFGRRPLGVLFILMVMALLGGALVARVKKATFSLQKPPPAAVARKELAVLRIALDDFRRDCGRYPVNTEGLEALVHNPDVQGWNGPYINCLKADPWKHRYLYSFDGRLVKLVSAGPDGVQNTEDDMELTFTAADL